MRILNLLERRKKNRQMRKSDEYRFYAKNAYLLDNHPVFSRYLGVETNFELVMANIIIRGIINKLRIEETIELEFNNTQGKSKSNDAKTYTNAIKEILDELPFIEEKEHRIVIPFFSRATNVIYLNEPDKLLTYPYNDLKVNYITTIVDPFETYGYELFDSFFTRLVYISSGKTCAAFFSIDALSILIINNQGRLDIEIPLFDRHLKQENTAQVMQRAQKSIEFYFNNDKIGFIHALKDQKLISDRIYYQIKKGI